MRTRRLERCARCEQPLPVCICDLVTPIVVQTKLKVLMHRLEAHKTTNTGRLAALALGAECALWGERDRARPTLPEGPILLLFPAEDARALRASDAQSGATLIVPDGNWPQARKIARRVRADAGERLEVVRLEGETASRYAFRHTKRAGAMSTFESIAHALSVLEGARGPEITARALAIFDAFVARHAPFSAGRKNRA
jgi:DTW domain-containing protein YfiP